MPPNECLMVLCSAKAWCCQCSMQDGGGGLETSGKDGYDVAASATQALADAGEAGVCLTA
jgi:hypothetical protein